MIGGGVQVLTLKNNTNIERRDVNWNLLHHDKVPDT